LVTCLSDESKDLLHKNKIFIPTPSSKSPLFNYTSFCKVLSVDSICSPRNLDLVTPEMFKMFMKQTSLKQLVYYPSIRLSNPSYSLDIPNLTKFPGAKDCLTVL